MKNNGFISGTLRSWMDSGARCLLYFSLKPEDNPFLSVRPEKVEKACKEYRGLTEVNHAQKKQPGRPDAIEFRLRQ